MNYENIPGLDVTAAEIRSAIAEPTATQQRLLEQLSQQAARLRESTFQLAVLGQFKRGKSTLLNALIGETLLSAGVLPLTAVPTFLTASDTLQFRLSYDSGSVEERQIASLDDMAREIAAATTEEQNPHNSKGLRRVDVGLPGTSWLGDATLIDTPGIGSTHAHNTDTAYAVLPECDAALFVCSVDPPITELELAYLDRICRTIPRVVVVLNKADLVDAGDLHKVLEFLASVIAGRSEAKIDRRVFAVSARQALTARRAGDPAGLEASGLAELERYVRATLIDRKRDVLALSIANKMAEIVAALAGDVAMTTRALSVPINELDAAIGAFEDAVPAFERERLGLEDALNGEWRRSLSRLDSLCEDVDRRVQQRLDESLQAGSICDDPEKAHATVTTLMTEFFDAEFAKVTATMEKALADSLQAHQRNYQALAARVRETAGNLLNVPVPSALPTDWFQAKRQSYWVGERQAESLSSLTVDGLARLLPAALRRRRQQRQFREAVNRALTRNVANLHWAMRQNIDDSFRSLLAAARAVIDTSIASTRDLLTAARQRRQDQGTPLQDQLARARATEQRLAALHGILLCRAAPQQ